MASLRRKAIRDLDQARGIGRSLADRCGRGCSLFDVGRSGGDGGEISAVELNDVQGW